MGCFLGSLLDANWSFNGTRGNGPVFGRWIESSWRNAKECLSRGSCEMTEKNALLLLQSCVSLGGEGYEKHQLRSLWRLNVTTFLVAGLLHRSKQQEKIITRLALRQLLRFRGYLNESDAPSCTSLTPRMRGVTKSQLKRGEKLANKAMQSGQMSFIRCSNSSKPTAKTEREWESPADLPLKRFVSCTAPLRSCALRS